MRKLPAIGYFDMGTIPKSMEEVTLIQYENKYGRSEFTERWWEELRKQYAAEKGPTSCEK